MNVEPVFALALAWAVLGQAMRTRCRWWGRWWWWGR
jgi:hypothetical protein